MINVILGKKSIHISRKNPIYICTNCGMIGIGKFFVNKYCTNCSKNEDGDEQHMVQLNKKTLQEAKDNEKNIKEY